MSVRNLIAALLLVCSVSFAWAQGFGGLGEGSDGFSMPSPNELIVLPRDHAAHPNYRIEWWYVTANMTGPDGMAYGLQWTLFRSALKPGGDSASQLWMGHAAVTTPTAHYVAERRARGGIGQAGVETKPFNAFIDDWQLAAPAGDGIDSIVMKASGAQFSFDVDLQARGPIVRHGNDGYSVKSEAGTASYYYSQPAYELSGTLQLPDGPVEVTGEAWLDREWSSQPLSGGQSGWDWFSLSFDDGNKLMAFQLREDGKTNYTSATWITPEGEANPIGTGDLRVAPLGSAIVEGRDVPVNWSLALPSRNVDVTVEALNPQSWMATSIPYWEGPARVSGSHSGVGYLEMTGYAAPPDGG